MNLYKCYIEQHSWGQVDYVDIEYIWAHDKLEAQDIYRKQYRFRKNKKGLVVTEIEYRRTELIVKNVEEHVTRKQIQFLGGYEYVALERVPHYYCKTCGKELTVQDRWCTGCDAEIQQPHNR